jgi:hypothetical protein
LKNQWTPSGLPSGLSLESSFGELFLESPFGEPIKITALEADSIPWIPQIIIPTDTQQTSSRLPKDLNQVLTWRPHLDIFFGELMWKTLLEQPFGETIE